jgi:hypothetical protein
MADRSTRIEFGRLAGADLIVDAVYAGGAGPSIAADPLGKLVPVGNQGGFRYKIRRQPDRRVLLVALFTSGREADWPDALDEQTGLFTYYGDNRRPGRELHDTSRGGNLILRDAFDLAHGDAGGRRKVPPFLLFASTGTGRDIRFRGLLAPGAATLDADDDLQAIWRATGGQRFQNYRARFTVLDEPVISRHWLDEVLAGDPLGPSCPAPWRSWVEGRAYRPLAAPATTVIRSKPAQTPPDPGGQAILATIHSYFSSDPHGFEACAVELWRMIAPATGAVDLTRPSRDGGRDAVGQYMIGPLADRLAVEFALEAKCHHPSRAVGVR